MIRKILSFPFRLLMLATLPTVWLGQIVMALIGFLGPLALLAEPVGVLVMVPFYLTDWLYCKIRGIR